MKSWSEWYFCIVMSLNFLKRHTVVILATFTGTIQKIDQTWLYSHQNNFLRTQHERMISHSVSPVLWSYKGRYKGYAQMLRWYLCEAACLMCAFELHPRSAWEWRHYRSKDVLSNSRLFLSHHALISILSLTRRAFGEHSPALMSNIVSKLMWDLW